MSRLGPRNKEVASAVTAKRNLQKKIDAQKIRNFQLE